MYVHLCKMYVCNVQVFSQCYEKTCRETTYVVKIKPSYFFLNLVIADWSGLDGSELNFSLLYLKVIE